MIKFRLLEEKDLEFLNNIRNECRDNLHNNSSYTIEETINWFRKSNPEFYIIYIDEIPIGYFRTSNLIENESIYIGADLHKNYRGRGLSYNAYLEFISFITEKYNLKKILLEVLSSNKIAYNLYKKLGFNETKIEYNFSFRNNEFINNIIMEKIYNRNE